MAKLRSKPIALLLLVALTFGVYAQVGEHGFLELDDRAYVLENPRVQSGLTAQGLVWAFTTTSLGNWHPLTWLSHMLDYELYGLNPAGHHLTSVLLHIGSTLLLWMLFQRMTGSFWRSLFVAGVFALHPLRVESVAWIAERKDVLSGFCWMLTLWCYVLYVERSSSWVRYLAVLTSFTLGLMAKPMLVTLPGVLLLLDYWPLGRFQRADGSGPTARRLVMEKGPLLALAAGGGLLALWAQRAAGAVSDLALLPLPLRIGNALIAYVAYLVKLLWPTRLAILYPHPHHALEAGQALVAGVILVGLTMASLRLARRVPALAVGWLWYGVTLLPVIGLIQVGVQSMADRYTYLPSIGLSVALAWGAPAALGKWRYATAWLRPAGGLALSLLALLTCLQLRYWRDSIPLFERTLRVTSDNFVIQARLAETLARRGRYEAALDHYRHALRIKPGFSRAHYGLGAVLARTGERELALQHYATALAIPPEQVQRRPELAALLAEGEATAAELRRHSEALRSDPESAQAHYGLAQALRIQGRRERSIHHLERVLEIDPGHTGARRMLKAARRAPDR